MSSFLSRANFDHVFGLTFQFLQDTSSLYVSKDELQALTADTMRRVAKEREQETPDLEMWNKQTIIMVRDVVRQRKPAPPPEPSANLQETSSEEQVVGDPFFTKLQELEVSRKSSNMWLQANAPPAQPAATLTTPPVPSDASQAPSVTTIYMQSPPDKGVAVHIRSWHRSWIQHPERGTYRWSGPLPNGIDVHSTYISCVIVPKQTMTWTPYVILEIEGAGGQVNECILVPDSKSVNSTWEYLRPTTKALGYIWPLALPWTLRFLDADREMLPYGNDCWSVQEIQHLRDISRLTIVSSLASESCVSTSFMANEWVLLQSNIDNQVRCKVVAVGPNTIDVQATVNVSFRGANILHMHRQSCVILEASHTMHSKK